MHCYLTFCCTFESTNKQSTIMTTRIQTGFYKMQWNGKTFFIENLRGEIDGQLVWYITSSDVDVENECDVLWATKYEAIEMIKNHF